METRKKLTRNSCTIAKNRKETDQNRQIIDSLFLSSDKIR